VTAPLRIEDLAVAFDAIDGSARVAAVDGVTIDVPAGATVGLVGESGCGKSVTALSILRLLDTPPAHVTGKVLLGANGTQRDLLALPEPALRRVRGKSVAMVFQDPMTSLNPVMTVGAQVAEVVRIHETATRAQAWERAVEMLGLVGIPSARERAKSYPHELSGGMRQRVMIAMALVCHPDVVIADEPTTALDVTIQAQILALLRQKKQEIGMSLLLITHDLGVVAETCDIVYVMYAGQIVESAPVAELFASPRHPYTQGLLASLPEIDGERRARLPQITGAVPRPGEWPKGCRFQDRCPRVIDACRADAPALVAIGAQGTARHVRCVNPVPHT
jgi:oligopeptide/dipeptide ABC transporter ATP-binding protein